MNHETTLRRDAIRCYLLALACACGYVLSGAAWWLWPDPDRSELPFGFDAALRTAGIARFEPRDTLPLTLIDIDDATHRSWGFPALTPRDHLATLLRTVAHAGAAAVVVDIDLSGTDTHPTDAILHSFLSTYALDTPVILVKRVERSGETLAAMASSLDPIVANNPRLSWAHATFRSDADGLVRRWMPWLKLCSQSQTSLLPSVAVQLNVVVHGPGWMQPPAVPAGGDCSDAVLGSQLLIPTRRLSGSGATEFSASARHVSAQLVLDPQLERDDAALFGGRVVLIGGTHAAGGDRWHTASGILPGVELIISSIRFASTQLKEPGGNDLWVKSLAMLLFVTIVWFAFVLRPSAAAVSSVLLALLVVVVAMAVWRFIGVFTAIETSLLLFLQYKLLETILVIWDEVWRSGLKNTLLAERYRSRV